MDPTARLIPVSVPARPAGLVLVLHGGSARGEAEPVSAAQLSVLRMIPIARQLSRAGRGQLAVFRLLNSHRGWDRGHTPVQDVGWALAEARRQLGGELATSLVGHSIGGRAALLAASHPGVVSAVALAPWVYASDDADLTGRRVLIVHGSKDRIADPAKSAAVARNLAGTADEVGYVLIDGAQHAMLRHGRRFAALAADFVVATVLDREVGGPVGRILSGQRWLEM
jgi:pimeloyl-ACP methyl ester carboxylesterase